jgi:hypothetical protein
MYFQLASNPQIELVELKNLSLFSDKVLNLPKEWNKTEWDFEELPYFPTKQNTMEYFKLVYPYYYSKLIKSVRIEEIFYDIITNSGKLLSEDIINKRWGKDEPIEEIIEPLEEVINYQKKIPKKFL